MQNEKFTPSELNISETYLLRSILKYLMNKKYNSNTLDFVILLNISKHIF